MIELEKSCNFPDFSTDYSKSKFLTSITDRKLQDKLMNERESDARKRVEQKQQNTFKIIKFLNQMSSRITEVQIEPMKIPKTNIDSTFGESDWFEKKQAANALLQ